MIDQDRLEHGDYTKYILSNVDVNGVRALIGRLDMPRHSLNSLYLTEAETKRVIKAAAKEPEDERGTTGRIRKVASLD